MAVAHGGTEHLLDLQALAHQHRGLVGEAELAQVALGVEAGARGMGEAVADGGGVDLAADERADQLRLVLVAHAEILAALVRERLRRGGLGLLVVVLAMDDGRELRAYLWTFFQTLSTLPQVVSTSTQPVARR